MNHSVEQLPGDETKTTDHESSGGGWKIRLGVLCGMLALALAGMGFTQSSQEGVWEFWLFVVLVYAALGLWRSLRHARQTGQSLRKSIGRELAHWGTLIGFLSVLLLFERREIINRQSASYFALMLLALSCCMAGIHVDWLLLVVGVVLAIMLVVTATLEQYSVVMWVVMILVACLAAAVVFIKSKRGAAKSKTD
jgi:hypothetical protein